MLSFRVFARLHLRRSPVARRFTLPVNVMTDPCLRIIEPHPRPFTLSLEGISKGFVSLSDGRLRTRRSRPCRDRLDFSSNASFSTFNRRSRPCRHCRLSTVDCQPPPRRSPTFTNQCQRPP